MLQGWKLATLLKIDPNTGDFLWIFQKFLVLLISKNICERLLFDFFNGSLLHGPKGSRSRLYASGFRVWVIGLVFKFLSGHELSPSLRPAFENLRRIKFFYWLFLVVLDGFRSFLDCFSSFLFSKFQTLTCWLILFPIFTFENSNVRL